MRLWNSAVLGLCKRQIAQKSIRVLITPITGLVGLLFNMIWSVTKKQIVLRKVLWTIPNLKGRGSNMSWRNSFLSETYSALPTVGKVYQLSDWWLVPFRGDNAVRQVFLGSANSLAREICVVTQEKKCYFQLKYPKFYFVSFLTVQKCEKIQLLGVFQQSSKGFSKVCTWHLWW